MTRNITATALALTVSVLMATTAAAMRPVQLPDSDDEPAAAAKPVQVYILSGQSNMVGIGQISGGSRRWSGITDATVSVYRGKYSPDVDYDQRTPIETMELPVYGWECWEALPS